MIPYSAVCVLCKDSMNSENFERSAMEDRLNKELHALLLHTRDSLELNQSEMAKRYCMAKNSYWELEAKNHGFSLLTAFLLLHDQEDPKTILNELYGKIEESQKEVTVLI